MVDMDFIKSLFEKYKNNDVDKSQILEAIEIKQEEEKIEKSILMFTDKLDLAKKFVEIVPLFYDKAGLFWKWNESQKKWVLIDEIDLMNMITYSSPANTINSKERNEILQAIKQVSREKQPKEAPTSWLQFDKEIVDIETGDRFEASPEYFFTNPIPHKIGYSDETPTIDRIFKEWVGEEYVKTLKEIIAFSMLRSYPLHRIFCLIGSGLNGKSCYLRLLKKVIGSDNCCSTELDSLLNSRFEITKLYKKLVCLMGETNFNEISKTSILKKLTGEDTIGFEYKNKTPFDDTNYAKIIIATNNLPTTSDKTIGFYRRWMIIDFPNQFDEKKDILNDIPYEEIKNLCYNSINLLIDLLKNRGFTNEGTIEERTKKYEDKSNPLEKFWNDHIIEDCDSHIFKHDFRKRLSDFCKDNHFRELSDVAISNFMKYKGVGEDRIQVDWFNNDGKKPYLRAWVGIKFK